jgi:transcriptional regulator with XRE-family HTH domain
LAAAAQASREWLARLGLEVRTSRIRRGWTQAELGAKAGLAQSTISLMERGLGGQLSVDAWQRVFVALGRPLLFEAGKDPISEPADAGHLRIQELVLRLGRSAGYANSFELHVRPVDPGRSADVGLRDDRRRRLVLVECWNTIGDVGAAARSSSRKVTEAEALAIALGGERPHSVHGCWVVRATARNRELVARYPEVFAARFPGSSEGWIRALATGSEPPSEPGLVWCDVAATRLFAWRRRS